MLIIKFLFIIPLWVASNPAINNFQDDCNKIEATLKTEDTSEGNSNGKVTVTLVKGDKKSAKFIFCEKNGKVLNENKFDSEHFEGLKKGEYLLIISTDECSKKLNFTIN